MDTKEIMEKLKSVISEKRPNALKFLGNSVSREEIESKIKTRPIPRSLIDIYSCASGTPDISGECFIISNNWDLLHIDDINDEIDLLEAANKFLVDNIYDYKLGMYSKNMIPFLYDGGGNIMCVRNIPDDESVWLILKDDEPCLNYLNINHFLLTAIQCYEQEAHFFDEEEGFWTYDPIFQMNIKDEIRESMEKGEI